MATVIYLEWLDSCHHNSGRWTPVGDLEFKREHIVYETIGFLLEETEYSFVVVQSKGVHMKDQDHLDSVMEIPKVAVINQRTYVENKETLDPMVTIRSEI